MKKTILTSCFILTLHFVFGQSLSKEYYDLTSKAERFYQSKNYKASALAYSEAFTKNGNLGLVDDRYNAACSWAMSGEPDSAFYNLERLIIKVNYSDYDRVIEDSDLNPLHSDKRWQALLKAIKDNKDISERNFNRPLANELDSIYREDQKYRVIIDSVSENFSNDSKEMSALWKIINEKDSSNLIAVEKILDKYGWLGADVVGSKGNSTLFLVIQHADIKTQEKYLPMMQEAVKNRKAYGGDLALLIDRIEMRNGRPQVYGSQITMKDGKHIIYPIIDEVNVNKRRAEVSLQPLEDYARHWNIDYKLPEK